ncbi:hypothetical protein EJ08DRAFT_438309 [Tothia fuscella]|uniref:Uncharacterized protein n=1 Tax=Tothia fuscella TaxID=1048955 RepID=A0A9P4U3D9_9PEZI|nr:hypothetical protein EJ08DRAFT_438309 [Tothia fuscella]
MSTLTLPLTFTVDASALISLEGQAKATVGLCLYDVKRSRAPAAGVSVNGCLRARRSWVGEVGNNPAQRDDGGERRSTLEKAKESRYVAPHSNASEMLNSFLLFKLRGARVCHGLD